MRNEGLEWKAQREEHCERFQRKTADRKWEPRAKRESQRNKRCRNTLAGMTLTNRATASRPGGVQE
jgi:hypothetical protein